MSTQPGVLLFTVQGNADEGEDRYDWNVATYLSREAALEHLHLVTTWRQEQQRRFDAESDNFLARHIREEPCPYDEERLRTFHRLEYFVSATALHQNPHNYRNECAVEFDAVLAIGWTPGTAHRPLPHELAPFIKESKS